MWHNHDSLIVKIFFTRNNNAQINGNITKKVKEKYPNILHYIENRYKDSSSIKETLGRIKNGIENRPACKYCNKGYVKYYGLKDGITIFHDYCCISCMSLATREKAEQTSILKYGTTSFTKTKIYREKAIKTCLVKYGVTNQNKSIIVKEKIKNTCLIKYGSSSPLANKEIFNKTQDTLNKKYGKSREDIIKKTQNTMKKRYGVISAFSLKSTIEKTHTKEVINKINATKRKNHTFNTSKPEEELYLYIKEKFPSVKRQYKDEKRYPYNCDFYIPTLDYFIELQGYYTHGKHPFNPNSKSDLQLIEEYKKKYGPECQAITIWAIKDVEKRNCAKKHNLNFKEVWDLDEGKEFIDKLYEIHK